MNHREPPQVPQGMRRAVQCLALLLSTIPGTLHAYVRECPVSVLPNGQITGERVGYLSAIGAPALRFAKAPPPPDLVSRPAPATPPAPTPIRVESTTAITHAEPARSVVSNGADQPRLADPRPEPAAPDKAVPLSILPDEIHPPIRPEDFLPFFQMPGATAPVLNANPAAGLPPPSSATYIQTQ